MLTRGQQGFPGAITALALLAALGCEGAPARSKPWRHARQAAPSPQKPTTSRILQREADRVQARRERSDTLRIHLPERVGHLHPMISPTLWGRRVTRGAVFETLLIETPDGYRPGLAKRWTISPGGREIRFEIQRGVTFHDGRKLSVVDVQFSIDSARSSRFDADHLRQSLSDVTAVELVSSHVVRVRLARPNGYVLRALAEVPILSQPIYHDRLESTAGPAIGTGPYRVAESTPDRVRLERYEDYWGAKPAIANIVYVYDSDAASALTAVKSGELDVLPQMSPIHHPEQAEAPGVAARLSPLRLRPPSMRFITLNATRPPFSDERMRRAVSLSIDRETLVDRIWDGLAWSPPAFTWPGGPVLAESSASPAHDPTRAAQLMDASGWRDVDGDGIRQRGSNRLMITVLATADDDPERDVVLETLRKAGFVLDVRTGPSAVLANRLRDRKFDLAFVDWSGATDMDISDYIGTGGRGNWGGFSDPAIDALLGELRRAVDAKSRRAVGPELAAALAEHMPIVPLTAPDPYGLVHKRVGGVEVFDGWFAVDRLQLLPDANAE